MVSLYDCSIYAIGLLHAYLISSLLNKLLSCISGMLRQDVNSSIQGRIHSFLKGGGSNLGLHTQKGGPGAPAFGPMLKSLHRGPEIVGGIWTLGPQWIRNIRTVYVMYISNIDSIYPGIGASIVLDIGDINQ